MGPVSQSPCLGAAFWSPAPGREVACLPQEPVTPQDLGKILGDTRCEQNFDSIPNDTAVPLPLEATEGFDLTSSRGVFQVWCPILSLPVCGFRALILSSLPSVLWGSWCRIFLLPTGVGMGPPVTLRILLIVSLDFLLLRSTTKPAARSPCPRESRGTRTKYMSSSSKASWVCGSCRGEASRRLSCPPERPSSTSWCRTDCRGGP